MIKMDITKDWRWQEQKSYMDNILLCRRKYSEKITENNHDHCEFCWATLGYDVPRDEEAYCTEDEYRWICPECYNDFKEYFNWKIKD